MADSLFRLRSRIYSAYVRPVLFAVLGSSCIATASPAQESQATIADPKPANILLFDSNGRQIATTSGQAALQEEQESKARAESDRIDFESKYPDRVAQENRFAQFKMRYIGASPEEQAQMRAKMSDQTQARYDKLNAEEKMRLLYQVQQLPDSSREGAGKDGAELPADPYALSSAR